MGESAKMGIKLVNNSAFGLVGNTIMALKISLPGVVNPCHGLALGDGDGGGIEDESTCRRTTMELRQKISLNTPTPIQCLRS